jgi:hypothetical protein
MELLGDVGHVESYFGMFRDCIVVRKDRRMVCAKRTLGLDWMHPMVLQGDEAQVEARFGPFGDSANLEQDSGQFAPNVP